MTVLPARFTVVPATYVYLLRPADPTEGQGGGRQVLLQLRSGTGYRDDHWAAAVAGHVEVGESVHRAAAREAVEGVGITELVLEPWCVLQRTGSTRLPVDERVDYFFTATTWTGTPEIREPDKAADLRWFDLDDLARADLPVVPHELRVLETVRTGRAPAFWSDGFADAPG